MRANKTFQSVLPLVIAACAIARADDPAGPPVNAVLEKLGNRIDGLEKRLQESDRELRIKSERLEEAVARIQQLESRLRTTPETPSVEIQAPEAVAAAKPVIAHDHGSPAASGNSVPHLNIRGFGDVGYHAERSPANSNSFGFGQIDLFTTSRLSDHLGVLLETVFESSENNALAVELERVLLQYRQNDFFGFDVGRYHSSIGYYNTAFHHGTWFQTAIGRPYLFAFEDEGGLLPIHNVGVSASGRIPSGRLGLSYAAEIGNGRAYKNRMSEPVQNTVDENNGKALNFALTAEPDAVPGLRLGASLYRDTLRPDGGNRVRQSIFAGHGVYLHGRTEFLNEFVYMLHKQDPSASSHPRTSVVGAYSQFAYRFGALRPYVRFEYLNAAASDPVAHRILGSDGWWRTVSGGIRYDFAEFAALKFQLGRWSKRDLAPTSQGAVQLSFTF